MSLASRYPSNGKARNGLKALRVGFFFLIALLALPHVLAGQPSSKMDSNPALDHAMQSMFGVQSFQQVVISPDGKRVAWVETQTGPDGASSANSVIYVAGLDAPTHSWRITAGDGKSDFEEHGVAWSPDSQHIAFLSDAALREQLQLFIAVIGGANLRQLTHVKGFLSNPAWSPDGKTIAFLFTENATRASGPLVAETQDEGFVSEDLREQRLTLVDLQTATIPCSELAGDFFDYVALPPDGAVILVADVSGHGASAAMLTGIVKSAFHSASSDLYEPASVAKRVASTIRAFAPHHFITLICVRVRNESRRSREQVNMG